MTIDGATGKVWFDDEVPVIDCLGRPGGQDGDGLVPGESWTCEAVPVGLGMDRRIG